MKSEYLNRMRVIASDEQLAWWKEQECFRTSGCLIGRLDGGVIASDGHKICLVIRGWIFSERFLLKSLSLRLFSGSTEAIPINLPRDDVASHFPTLNNAKECGFLAVFDVAPIVKFLDSSVHVSFEATTEEDEVIRGTFEATQIRRNLLEKESISPSVSEMVKRSMGAAPSRSVLIVTPQNQKSDLVQIESRASKLINKENALFETVLVDGNHCESKEMEACFNKIRLNCYSHIILNNLEAMEFFLNDPLSMISSLISAKFISLPENPLGNAKAHTL